MGQAAGARGWQPSAVIAHGRRLGFRDFVGASGLGQNHDRSFSFRAKLGASFVSSPPSAPGSVMFARSSSRLVRIRACMALQTVLFIDEVHRFNKGQQDALLPAVENGWVILVAATTENPSFSVVSPLLSRSCCGQVSAP